MDQVALAVDRIRTYARGVANRRAPHIAEDVAQEAVAAFLSDKEKLGPGAIEQIADPRPEEGRRLVRRYAARAMKRIERATRNPTMPLMVATLEQMWQEPLTPDEIASRGEQSRKVREVMARLDATLMGPAMVMAGKASELEAGGTRSRAANIKRRQRERTKVMNMIRNALTCFVACIAFQPSAPPPDGGSLPRQYALDSHRDRVPETRNRAEDRWGLLGEDSRQLTRDSHRDRVDEPLV